MKAHRLLALVFFAFMVAAAVTGCKKKCKGEDPRARVTNNGTQRASVQVKTSGGNTINLNNVDPGATTEYASYAPGNTTFTIVVNNLSYVKVINVGSCTDYDIAIDAVNNITVSGTDRNE